MMIPERSFGPQDFVYQSYCGHLQSATDSDLGEILILNNIPDSGFFPYGSSDIESEEGASPNVRSGDESPPAAKRQKQDKWSIVAMSDFARHTINPIRRIVDVMMVSPNPDKHLIRLHIGDPTITGVLPTHPSITEAAVKSLQSGMYNGYGPAVGFHNVREEVAKYASRPEAPITTEDVILTSGCSHALQLSIEALVQRGQNVLVPAPGFPLYGTLMEPLDIESRFYNLLPDKGWEMNLEQLESLIDEKTAAIIINNPSNPCGAVFSREHLEAFLEIAEAHKVPVIADEIYGDMVYDGAKFFPLASLTPKVPILTCDGLSKRFLVPGWRLGWLIIHDRAGVFHDIRIGLRQLASKIVGPSSLIQGAVPHILNNIPESFYQNTRDILEKNSKILYSQLSSIPGIKPVKAYGAMYMMIILDMEGFSAFASELELVQGLIREESLYCLPGTAFHCPNSVRLVVTYPESDMCEAVQRIRSFCQRHYQKSTKQSFSSSEGLLQVTQGTFAKRNASDANTADTRISRNLLSLEVSESTSGSSEETSPAGSV